MMSKLLTEKQLVKMPKSAYMNEQQLEFFKHRLEEMREELRDNIAHAREDIMEVENEPDPLDVASKQEMLQLKLRTSERLTKLLHKVESALERIDRGEYGYCEETGEPIGIPRLLARPTATLSIQSKEREEFRERTEREE